MYRISVYYFSEFVKSYVEETREAADLAAAAIRQLADDDFVTVTILGD